MGPGSLWMWGMWIFPIIMLVAALTFIYFVFGKGGDYSSRHDRGGEKSESALDILKKRYAGGEITKEEFERMKDELGF